MAQGAAETFRQYFFQHCAEKSRLYPGVSACLENLQAVSRAVATTKMTFMAVKVVEEMGIAHHFDLVQGSDGIPHKPDPAVLSRVLEKLEKQPHKSWFVGDTVYDIQAGKAVGMRTCAVTYGIGLVDELERRPRICCWATWWTWLQGSLAGDRSAPICFLSVLCLNPSTLYVQCLRPGASGANS